MERFVLPVWDRAVSVIRRKSEASSETLEAPSIMRTHLGGEVHYIKENGAITEAEMSELLGVKKTRTFLIAKAMTDLGLIAANGRCKNKKYYLV